jgi:predicted PurR-regulated permease PerM
LADFERQQYLVQFLQSNLNMMVGVSQQFVTQFATLLSSALTFLSSLGSLLVYITLTWIMTIMASIQHKEIETLFGTLWPYTKPTSTAWFAKLKTKLVSWLKGQAIICSVMMMVMGCVYLVFSFV